MTSGMAYFTVRGRGAQLKPSAAALPIAKPTPRQDASHRVENSLKQCFLTVFHLFRQDFSRRGGKQPSSRPGRGASFFLPQAAESDAEPHYIEGHERIRRDPSPRDERIRRDTSPREPSPRQARWRPPLPLSRRPQRGSARGCLRARRPAAGVGRRRDRQDPGVDHAARAPADDRQGPSRPTACGYLHQQGGADDEGPGRRIPEPAGRGLVAGYLPRHGRANSTRPRRAGRPADRFHDPG